MYKIITTAVAIALLAGLTGCSSVDQETYVKERAAAESAELVKRGFTDPAPDKDSQDYATWTWHVGYGDCRITIQTRPKEPESPLYVAPSDKRFADVNATQLSSIPELQSCIS